MAVIAADHGMAGAHQVNAFLGFGTPARIEKLIILKRDILTVVRDLDAVALSGIIAFAVGYGYMMTAFDLDAIVIDARYLQAIQNDI